MLFKKKEYKERLKKVKESMQKQGIDLLISHDPANMNYLTGYDAWSCLLYTSPSPRDRTRSRMPSSA